MRQCSAINNVLRVADFGRKCTRHGQAPLIYFWKFCRFVLDLFFIIIYHVFVCWTLCGFFLNRMIYAKSWNIKKNKKSIIATGEGRPMPSLDWKYCYREKMKQKNSLETQEKFHTFLILNNEILYNINK